MKKNIYIFICFLLSVKFWNLALIVKFMNQDILLLFTWLWAILSFLFFRNNKRLPDLFSIKYSKYIYWIFLGVFISMFSAQIWGGQDLIVTILSQREIYSFILLLLALLYAQPTEKDIHFGLKWVSYITIFVWLIVALNPSLVSIDTNEVKQSSSDFGYYVSGIHFVVLYFYIRMQKFIEYFSWRSCIEIIFLLLFIFLYQNRSMMLGVFLILVYGLSKFRAQKKAIFLTAIALFIIFVVFFTVNIWMDLIQETQNQLNDPDYNRNIAMAYYLFDYSPNWFCLIFGNGFGSIGNSELGAIKLANYDKGIFASDLGLIGMWTDFGIIPLIVIYIVLISFIMKKKFPLYLKFIAFHIILIPSIFHFWNNPGIFFFVILFYLNAYHSEKNNLRLEVYAYYHNSKL